MLRGQYKIENFIDRQFLHVRYLLREYFQELIESLNYGFNQRRRSNTQYIQILPDEIRDEVFKELKSINRNNICLDCEKKNTKWTSIHLGVHLCIDCAGKHRQYGVMYSFVKSCNLDKWNRKQILFMQKGGNQRALDYFTKCGVISQTHKHIDYKSPIVQRYKSILTAEVEGLLDGKQIAVKQTPNKIPEKSEQLKTEQQLLDAPKQIPHAELVQNEEKGKKKKKKNIGRKINLQDFDNLVLDDGVPIQQKQKIVKSYENAKTTQVQQQQKIQNNNEQPETKQSEVPLPVVNDVKQMSQEQTKQKLEELATQNVKSISSEAFKDTSTNNDAVKQKLNKLSDSQSISSNTLFGDQNGATEEGSMDKLKGIVSGAGQKIYDASEKIYDAGGKIYNKFSRMWNKK